MSCLLFVVCVYIGTKEVSRNFGLTPMITTGYEKYQLSRNPLTQEFTRNLNVLQQLRPNS